MEDFLDRMKARKQAPKLPDNNFPSEKFNKEISPKNVFVLPRGEEKNRAFEAAEKQIVQNRLR
ncbi:MAG: hypothetical protein KGL95_07375, partial [Patescibacteria group bacterium]|nr:hypothetical protein [Patescibacteria group bacterium]